MGITFTEAQLTHAYNRVRDELFDAGLLVEGRYLDDIECRPHFAPSALFDEESARVYDDSVPWQAALVGFEPGTIYVFAGAPVRAYVPGGTLTDVLRHEFAHAWAWRDKPFFRRRWFKDAFGAGYSAGPWEQADEFDPASYVSPYATTQAKEDFAETFMLYLRVRRNLAKYRPRRGLHQKLEAVEHAVREAAATRVHHARRPK